MTFAGVRRAIIATTLGAIAVCVLGNVPAVSQPPNAGTASAARKVDPALRADFDRGGRAPTVIEFADSADLAAAARQPDWTRRGQAVVDALQATARHSQAAVVDQLTRQGVRFQSFWIDNSLYVPDGTGQLAMAAAADAHVTAIRPAETVPLEKPAAGQSLAAAAGGVEWGIADIKADQVWQTLGDRGEGIVVANIDSGVQFDHPALVAAYRGNRGDGSFDHNYNWWDPSSVCGSPSLAPCDNNGHGSHTMGTMVGDGGEGNRIGVAPGAKWIAAKGCESGGCSEFALTSAAQWVLAPTDLSGQHPDVSKRPNIVNNSWGAAGGDDWYRDFVRAWVASGMFPAFAAGNDGPACGTASSPGDYDESYAVGNYAAGGTIAPTSSRGAAASGLTKPDISAPGTNVRSSIAHGQYAAFSGTSMATPHVAGTVALMWSRSPAMVGDIEGTRQILDDTARDKADGQCGGTPDDNNVYGEGELDALAAVSAVPTGNVGTVSGTVTDAATGEPIADAALAFTGPSTRNASSRSDGTYSISLSEGHYEVAVSLFGYRTAHVSDLVVTGGEAGTRDFTLSAAPRVRMSGQVHDGSGHGWPLYAKVVVENTPASTYTDPATGRYSLRIPVGASYKVDVESQYPGYVGQTQQVDVEAAVSRDYALAVDAASCTAPGYRRGAAGLHQSFAGATAPAGWTIVDHGSTGQVWRFDDPGGRGNLTGGSGGFAVLDSYEYGRHASQDASLVSPATNLRTVADPVLEFRTDFKSYFHDRAAVDLSLDGGSTWTNVWRPTADVRGPGQVRVPLPAAAHQASVQVRFHYGPVGYAWWWQVDDVYVGPDACDKAPGGLLLGRTTSSVTGKGLAGVSVGPAGAVPARSVATPDDTGLGDGLYWLFAPGPAAGRYTAALYDYTARTEKVQVFNDAATRHDFTLGSGRLAAPRTVTASVELGQSASVEIALTNTGDQPATYELGERESGGQVTAPAASDAVADVPVQHIPVQAKPLPGDETAAANVPLSHPAGGEWTDRPNYPMAVEDPVVGVYGGRLYSFTGGRSNPASYRYDPATQAWTPIADAPIAREAAAGAYVGGGRFVVTGGLGGDDAAPVAATSIYDADTDTWTSGAPNPSPWAGAGSAVLDGKLYVVGGCLNACGRTDVLRYDPATDVWTRLADFPYAVARSSCGGIGSTLYCAGGIGPEADGLATWAYTPATNTWHQVADLPQDMWGGGSAVVGDELVVSGGVINHGSMKTNEGYAYDPAANHWRPLPNRHYALFNTAGACGLFTVGGTDGERFFYPYVEQLPGFADCALPAHIGWLSVDHPSRTVPPGQRQVVRVTLDAARVTQPGTYLASLRVGERTPYPVAPITVRLVVKPRS